MNQFDKNNNIILSCSKKGEADQLLLDSHNFFEAITFPVGLHSLIAPDSMDSLAELWLQVVDKSLVENVPIRIYNGNRYLTMSFSGYLINDTVLLCGSNKKSSVEKMLSEITQINNEQLNNIRTTEKQLFSKSQQDKEKWDLNDKVLNDLSELNNELINYQRELVQKNIKISQLNKKLEIANENIQMFAYTVSHDLKEPVRMIHSFMGLFKKKYFDNLDDKGKEYVEYAMDGSHKLNHMIDDLLSYYRTTNVPYDEIVNLNEVIREVTLVLKRQIEENNASITIGELPTVHGSFTGWRHLLQNLVSNSIKFVPTKRTPEISISAKQVGNFWDVSVVDNGIGIEPEFQESMYKLFKRANQDEEFQGSGLGLPIVKKIVQNFDGEILVKSEIDKGTTFTIRVPKKNQEL